MRLVIRADASTTIGTGHVMRCIALAQAWQDLGGAAEFICSAGSLRVDRIEIEGFTCRSIDSASGTLDDAARTAEEAKGLGGTWVVVDGYQFDAAYQCVLKGAGLRVLCIDDNGHAKRYAVDVILNQNLGADEAMYAGRRDDESKLLLGTKYALIRREFRDSRDRPDTQRPTVRRVLVTLGGADFENVTLKVLEALELTATGDLDVTVIAGAMNPHLSVLEPAARQSRHRVVIERAVSCQLPVIMSQSDLAISAAGSTVWELSLLGVPSILITTAENQRRSAAELHGAEAAVSLGDAAGVTQSSIASAVEALCRDLEKRKRMRRIGMSLVDGMGAVRTAMLLAGQQVRLRRVESSDCRMIWEWANSPSMRAASFSSDPIPWERHRDWFDAQLEDPATVFWVAEDADGGAIGQIRFHSTSPEEAVVSVSLAPGREGRGFGTQLIRIASQRMVREERARVIHAYIRPGNTASVSAFARAGFFDSGSAVVNEEPALHYTFTKKAYP